MWIPVTSRPRSWKAALAGAARANIDTTGGTLVDEHPMMVAGVPGREQRITAGPFEYVFRFAFVGNGLYSVSIQSL
jgi:hypothetical protein